MPPEHQLQGTAQLFASQSTEQLTLTSQHLLSIPRGILKGREFEEGNVPFVATTSFGTNLLFSGAPEIDFASSVSQTSGFWPDNTTAQATERLQHAQ